MFTLILATTKVFNPGAISGAFYNFISVFVGFICTAIALLSQDFDQTVLDMCGPSKGSFFEIIYGYIVFLVWPIMLITLYKVRSKSTSDPGFFRAQRHLVLNFYLHTFIFSVNLLPISLLHFGSFAWKWYIEPDNALRTFIVVLAVLSFLVREIAQFFLDEYLRHRVQVLLRGRSRVLE